MRSYNACLRGVVGVKSDFVSRLRGVEGPEAHSRPLGNVKASGILLERHCLVGNPDEWRAEEGPVRSALLVVVVNDLGDKEANARAREGALTE